MKELRLLEARCAVTAFDLKIQLNKDGRQRGLWIFFDDTSTERAAAYKQWLGDAIELWKDMASVHSKDKAMTEFAAWLTTNDVLRNLVNSQVREGGLMEWPEALKFYEAMGKEIDKARERGDLP